MWHTFSEILIGIAGGIFVGFPILFLRSQSGSQHLGFLLKFYMGNNFNRKPIPHTDRLVMPKSNGGFHAAQVPAVKEEAKRCDFPWHDIFEAPLLDWLETFPRAHNTVKETMFLAISPT